MLDDLTTRDQRMMFGLVTLVHLADSKEQLDSDTETLYSTARKHPVSYTHLRSGTKLTNEWDGMTHDYTRKGGIVHAEIMLPAHAPPEFADRSILWNSVEPVSYTHLVT